MKLKVFIALVAVFLCLLFAAQTIQAANEAQQRTALFLQLKMLQQQLLRLQNLVFGIQPQSQPAQADVNAHLPVSAKAYLAQNLSDNTVLAAKNANQSYIIASVTKLMNAVVALEHIGPNQTIELTSQMLSPEGQSPSLFVGLTISRDNLLKASLVQSTNDAAEALTYFVGKEQFLQLMNQKAQELGMGNTAYYDAHGLNPKNTSTAADLSKLVAYIYQRHPEILAATKDTHFQLPNKTGAQLTFKNMNNFSEAPDFIGGKTGWLPESKQTFASVFQINGSPVAIILLASENRKEDTQTILNSLKPKSSF